VPEVIEEALNNAGMTVDQVDWLLLHQANIRIMEVVAAGLGIPAEKVSRESDARSSRSNGGGGGGGGGGGSGDGICYEH